MTISSALITGAGGFIGRHLVKRMAESGTRTFALTRSPARLAAWLCAQETDTRNLKILTLDSYENTSLEDALRGVQANVVFHLAACGIQPRISDPKALFDGNVSLLLALAKIMQDWALHRFIAIGSCAEYGASPDGGLSRETDLPAPRCMYGASKAAATMAGLGLSAQSGFPFACLRLFGVYGPGESSRRLLPYLITQLRAGQIAELTSGEQVRDFTYVSDVCEALLAAAFAPRLPEHPIYNVCTGKPVTVRVVGETVRESLSADPGLLQWGVKPLRDEETSRLVGDPSRFHTAVRWRPQTSLQDGVRQMISACNLAGQAS